VDIRGEQHIFIGEDVYIGPHVVMLADKGAEIHIGNKVMFGPQVKVIANDHRFDDPTKPIKYSGYAETGGIWVGMTCGSEPERSSSKAFTSATVR